MTKMRKKILAVSLALVLLTVMAAGACGGGEVTPPGEEEEEEPPPTVDEVVANSVAALEEVTTWRVDQCIFMDMEVSGLEEGHFTISTSQTGAMDLFDREFESDMTMSVVALGEEMETRITVYFTEETLYMRTDMPGMEEQWVKQHLPSTEADLLWETMTIVLTASADMVEGCHVEQLSLGEVGGVPCYLLEGSLDMQDFSELFEQIMGSTQALPFDVSEMFRDCKISYWIAKDTYNMVQVDMTATISMEQEGVKIEGDMEGTSLYYDHGKEIIIVLPPEAEGALPGEEEEAGESNRFLELLGLIPSIIYEENIMRVIDNVVIIDYASFREDNDIPFSTPEEYFNAMAEDEMGISLIETGSYITGNSYCAEYSTIEDKHVGYNVTDVDAEILGKNYVLGPSRIMIAAIGRFSPQATEDALSHQDEWPTWMIDAYTTEEYSGVTLHSWGDGTKFDLLNTLSPPHLDNLGRAKPLAVTEEYLFSANFVSDVESMIYAARNETDSLADIPEWALVANEMSAMGVWATIIEYAWILGSREPLMHLRVIDDPGPRLKRFTVFGSGLGRDEKGIYTAIVLVCESPDDAQENISLLEQRIESVESVWNEGKYWNEIITDTEIHVEGNVLIAKLYTPYWNFWSSCASDNLLLYEF